MHAGSRRPQTNLETLARCNGIASATKGSVRLGANRLQRKPTGALRANTVVRIHHLKYRG